MVKQYINHSYLFSDNVGVGAFFLVRINYPLYIHMYVCVCVCIYSFCTLIHRMRNALYIMHVYLSIYLSIFLLKAIPHSLVLLSWEIYIPFSQ
jgi:hypothetical protein